MDPLAPNNPRTQADIEAAETLLSLSGQSVNSHLVRAAAEATVAENMNNMHEEEPVGEVVAASQTLLNIKHGTDITAKENTHGAQGNDDQQTTNPPDIVEASSSTTPATVQAGGRILSPPNTMIANIAAGGSWFHDLLQCEPLQLFVKYGLRASTITGEAEDRVAAVLETMSPRYSVQEACWYLDANDWDVEATIKVFAEDEKLRKTKFMEPWGVAGRLMTKVETQNYKPALLNFEYLAKAPATDTLTTTFCDGAAFDRQNRKHIKALNQWRNDCIRMLLTEPPDFDNGQKMHIAYTETERRWVRNRFAAGIGPLGVGMTVANVATLLDQFNRTFVGRFVPGNRYPCLRRTVASINVILKKEKVDDNGDELTGGSNNVNYQTALRIRVLQKRERREFAALVSVPEPEVEEEEQAEVEEEKPEVEGKGKGKAKRTRTMDSDSEEEGEIREKGKGKAKAKKPRFMGSDFQDDTDMD